MAGRRAAGTADRDALTSEQLRDSVPVSRETHGQQGLGLAIAAQAARLLGTRLVLEPTPGVGSTFRLLLSGGTAAS